MPVSSIPWHEGYDAPATPIEYEREPKVFGYCDECGHPIYEGDNYYEVGYYKFCEDCVSYKTAGE